MRKISYILPVVLIAVILTANLIISKEPSLSFSIASAKQSLGGPMDNEAAILNTPSINAKSQILNDNKELILVNDSAVLNPAVLSSKPTSDNREKNGYFIIPAAGWNWGGLHNNNAVDIANSCGTPVYAAAEGLIIENASSGWNSGYGAYVKIEHPSGAKTVYAHLSKITVSEGKYVNQGELIGNIGNTGNIHGPTGCHLHFEVRGAKNPLAK